MAKAPFSKLGLTKNQEIITLKINEQEIEVKQYLPYQDKLNLISNVVNYSAEDQRYYNPGKIRYFLAFELIENYTNISFTEKQKEDMPKLFDLLVGNGIYNEIYNAIPASETDLINDILWESIDSVYKYQNSIMGILDSVSQDYQNANFDASAIQEKLADPNNLDLLRQIAPLIGLK